MDMENRKVVVYGYQRKSGSGYIEPSKIEIGKGALLAFGVNYEELTYGVRSFSTAIVEMDDGSVKNVPVETIKFEPDYKKGSSVIGKVQEYDQQYNDNLRNMQREKNYRTSAIADEMASSFKAAYSEDMTPKEQLPVERRKWINEELEKYIDKHCCENLVQIRGDGRYKMIGDFEEKHLDEIVVLLKMAIE